MAADLKTKGKNNGSTCTLGDKSYQGKVAGVFIYDSTTQFIKMVWHWIRYIFDGMNNFKSC